MKFINTVTIPKNYVFVSFDGVALFTNILKLLFIQTINENWGNISKMITIKKEILTELVTCCFEISYFSFQTKFYIQVDGTSMDGPASPAIANVVMKYVLERV